MLPSWDTDPSRFSGAEIVTLLVGRDKVKFLVHKDILCQESPYFEKAFKSGFKEATENSLTLLGEKSDIVNSLVDWLYSGTLDFSVPNDRQTQPCYREPLYLYLVADTYDFPKLRDEIIEYFFGLRFHKQLPSYDCFTKLWRNTMENDRLRKLFVDVEIWSGDTVWFEDEERKKWLSKNSEIAVDLLAAALYRIKHPNENPLDAEDASKYYDTPTTRKQQSTGGANES